MTTEALTVSDERAPSTIQQAGTMAEAAVSRQAQEVQAGMVIAKKFPRDENQAFTRIKRSCSRRSLAEVACYEYPKGGTKVTGPSIRLAEVLAQNWGNIDFGIIELDQRPGESSVMTYCWDLETNTRQTKVFQVPHTRKARGKITTLDDPREIYEMVANQGARRLRACILGIIPRDIQDAAVEACEKALVDNTTPIKDRIREMLSVFETKFNVSQAKIEEYLGHDADAISEAQLVKLRKVYNSIKDGMATADSFFDKMKKPERKSTAKKDKPEAPVEEQRPAPAPEAGEADDNPDMPPPLSWAEQAIALEESSAAGPVKRAREKCSMAEDLDLATLPEEALRQYISVLKIEMGG